MHRRAFLELAAGGALAAAAPSLAFARRSARGRPLAFATADDEASVVVLDLLTGGVHRHIGTNNGPSSIETVGGGRIALVGHAGIGVVSLIDIASLRVSHVLEGFGEPRYAAAGPGGRYAYVTDAERGELVVIDLARARVIDRVQAGALARHLTISLDGRRLFAALGPQAPAIAMLDATDPRHPRLVRTFAPVDRAHDVVVSSDGTRLWVTSGTTDRVAIHDIRTLAPVAKISAGAPPQHVAMGNNRVFVASGADGRMQVHRRDGQLLRTTHIPLDSYNVTFGFGHVVTPSLMLGTVTTLGSTGAFIRRERVTAAAHDACVARALL
jgi:DNA-binding beta-propeller fold protein YncE